MKHALILAQGPWGDGCRVEERLTQRGLAVDTHFITNDLTKPDKSVPFPDVSGYDLIVVMGSEQSLTRKEEIGSWVHAELDLIRSVYEAGTPILGVCFGGQMLAEALGGSVEAEPEIEIGWFEIETAEGADNPIGRGPWLEWHHDRFTLPPGAELLAETDKAAQLFRIGRCVGTQFHPEVDTSHIELWLECTPDSYFDEYGIDQEHVLADTRTYEAANIKQCHGLVDWFLDDVAFPPSAEVS